MEMRLYSVTASFTSSFLLCGSEEQEPVGTDTILYSFQCHRRERIPVEKNGLSVDHVSRMLDTYSV